MSKRELQAATADFQAALRTSGARFDSRAVAEIAELTDRNNHTEALIEGAKLVGATKVVKILGHLLKIQDLEGSLPHDLSNYRYQLNQQVMRYAKQAFSPDEYEQFHGAF